MYGSQYLGIAQYLHPAINICFALCLQGVELLTEGVRRKHTFRQQTIEAIDEVREHTGDAQRRRIQAIPIKHLAYL